MWQSVKILNVFNTLTLKQIFRKTENFFEQLDYKFLVERTKIESASFPYKTAISEANVRTNRMVSPKWTYHKEWSFAINFFNFWKLCFSWRSSYKYLIWCTNDPNAHVRTFCKRWSFIWRCFFPVSMWVFLTFVINWRLLMYKKKSFRSFFDKELQFIK